MSMHRALGEYKTYDDRINNVKNEIFIIPNRNNNEKIGSKTIDEFKTEVNSNMQSIKALIENKKRLKDAMVISNAENKVEIASHVYSVAGAIERKRSIALEEDFLRRLKQQYTSARKRVEDENNQLPQKLENYLESVLGDKVVRKQEDVEEYSKAFMKKNTYELIDPAGIEDYIKKLEKDIIDFKNEVDYVLSESNATTFIEVNFVD